MISFFKKGLIITAVPALMVSLFGCSGQTATNNEDPSLNEGSAASASSVPSETGAAAPSIAPVQDYAKNMQACMKDKGWALSIAEDGSISPGGIPEEQLSQYMSANDECLAVYGYDIALPAMTQDQATAFLAGLQRAADCVVGEGYTVPSAPSDQVIIAGLMTEARDPGWDVYAGASDYNDLQALYQACPPPTG